MESRQIIILEETGNQTLINSTAQTLADLKVELNQRNINHTNMSFFEGRTRTELTRDDQLLPDNFTWRGNPCRDIVVALSLKNEKIQSGATSRKELILKVNSILAKHPELKKIVGNCTQRKSEFLEEFINKYEGKQAPRSTPCTTECPSPEEIPNTVPSKVPMQEDSLLAERMCDLLFSKGIFSTKDMENLGRPVPNTPISKEEADEILRAVRRR